MKSYTIENIFITKSENVNFKYDIFVVDFVDGVRYVTNIRAKYCYPQYGSINELHNSVNEVLDNLDVSSARELFIQGYYKYVFSDRKNKMSVRSLRRMQRFIDAHQKTDEKTL